jgi:hypothetical protein
MSNAIKYHTCRTSAWINSLEAATRNHAFSEYIVHPHQHRFGVAMEILCGTAQIPFALTKRGLPLP